MQIIETRRCFLAADERGRTRIKFVCRFTRVSLVHLRLIELFHDFELEVELFPAADRREIEFPEFSCEPEGWPALIEINYKLHA